MGQMRNAFRAYAYDHTSPAELLRRMSRHITGEEMATAVCMTLDPYTQELAEGVAAETQELDATIGKASSAWPPERLGALERNILRIALYELDRDEVPLEVSIDEAVRLARRYSSEDAAKLVNGILGKVAKEAKR